MRFGIFCANRADCRDESDIDERYQKPALANESIKILVMKVTFLFRELIHKPTSEWTTERLILLPVIELSDLCQLAGIPHSGTKQELVERLVDQTELQR